jgi:hypothetical protein
MGMNTRMGAAPIFIVLKVGSDTDTMTTIDSRVSLPLLILCDQICHAYGAFFQLRPRLRTSAPSLL